MGNNDDSDILSVKQEVSTSNSDDDVDEHRRQARLDGKGEAVRSVK